MTPFYMKISFFSGGLVAEATTLRPLCLEVREQLPLGLNFLFRRPPRLPFTSTSDVATEGGSSPLTTDIA